MAFEKLTGPCADCQVVDYCHAETTSDDIMDWPEEKRNLALCFTRITTAQEEKKERILQTIEECTGKELAR